MSRVERTEVNAGTGANRVFGRRGLQAVDHALWHAGWFGAWAALLALALWLDRLAVVWLLFAAAGALLFAVAAARADHRRALAAAAVLGVAIGFAGVVQWRLLQVADEWPAMHAAIERDAEAALGRALDRLVTLGETAVAGVAAAATPPYDMPSPQLFARLERARAHAGVSAVAVFGRTGEPLAWAGEHRGAVPDSVRLGEREYVFGDGPLFSYLYFTRRLSGGRTAVAAVLLSTGVEQGAGSFAERFADTHGLMPRFTTPTRADGDAVWDWRTDRAILSVSFAAAAQEHWRSRIANRGRSVGAAIWVIALLVLGAAWLRGHAGPVGVAILAGTLGLILVPWSTFAAANGVFSAAHFLLPFGLDLSLGQLLILLFGLAAWLLASAAVTRAMRRVPLPARIAAAMLTLPAALLLVRHAASDNLLAGDPAGGMSLVLAAALLIAIPLFALLAPPSRADGTAGGAVWAVAGAALAAAMAAGWSGAWQPGREIPLAITGAWAVPFALFAIGARRGAGRSQRWFALLGAGWLAGTAVLPVLWTAHLDARLAQAETELARLGTHADPFLDFLLRQYSDQVLRLADRGERGTKLLYDAWVESGLAAEGYEARLTFWSGEQPGAELALTDAPLPAGAVAAMRTRLRAANRPLLERYTQLDSVHYLLLIPLSRDEAVSVAVPPRRRLGRATALARLLRTEAGGAAQEDLGTLTLVPAAAAHAVRGASVKSTSRVRWIPSEDGWRSETLVRFPSGPAHAHLLVRTPSWGLLVTRALLALSLILGTLAVLQAAAGLLRGRSFATRALRWRWIRSFRGRLTLALFVFFLFPTVAFGAIAYRALSREVSHAATALAFWSLGRATVEPRDLSLAALGQHVGADLLLYRDGSLNGATAPEVLDLGLFNTWLSPQVYFGFASGESTEAVEQRRLGSHEYLVAYRRLENGGVLALPTPLASGEIARRQREFADVLLLITLLGAGLSFALSLLVGRALSRPIEELSRAAAVVGGGDLRVRVPEERQDEFGGVYRAFNHMVRRLNQARGALVRETRRTEAIVAEAGTGVLALDGQGRIALVNPRAAEILGGELAVGASMPLGSRMLEDVADRVERFLQSGAVDRAHEIDVDGRIVRLRLRRLPGEDGAAGAVLVVEDVTAEIRSARVLAWGEMARQVAHEIKNPLTPIKLSVQHLRRAYHDGRPDFAKILDRNIDSTLREIDRLGEIARAFARFGTPAPDAGDCDAVELRSVVDETLALYRGGADGTRYRVVADPATPAALARVGELKEVLVNLLENAREALDGAGEICVGIAPSGDDRVELTITDTGEGIPAEQLSRIFEPQFSTRSSGTGLGLAIVRRLVDSWGGEIRADSRPGEGTTIRICLRAAG